MVSSEEITLATLMTGITAGATKKAGEALFEQLKDRVKALTGWGTQDSGSGAAKVINWQKGIDSIAELDVPFEMKADIEMATLGTSVLRSAFERERQRLTREASIILGAANMLPQEVEVHELDLEWVEWFFDSARTATTKETQEIWSRILSQEALQPGRIAKRSVEALRVYDHQDAEWLRRLSERSFWNHAGGYAIPYVETNDQRIHRSHNSETEDLGLIDERLTTLHPTVSDLGGFTYFLSDGSTIDISLIGPPDVREDGTRIGIDAGSLVVFPLTRIGSDLVQLPLVPPKIDLIAKAFSRLRSARVMVRASNPGIQSAMDAEP